MGHFLPWITLFAALGGFIWLATVWPSESVKGLPREDIFDAPDPYQVSLLNGTHSTSVTHWRPLNHD